MKFVCINNESGNSRFFEINKIYEGSDIEFHELMKYDSKDYLQVYNPDGTQGYQYLIVKRSDFMPLKDWRYKRVNSILK